jgi:hypothetical protein
MEECMCMSMNVLLLQRPVLPPQVMLRACARITSAPTTSAPTTNDRSLSKGYASLIADEGDGSYSVTTRYTPVTATASREIQICLLVPSKARRVPEAFSLDASLLMTRIHAGGFEEASSLQRNQQALATDVAGHVLGRKQVPGSLLPAASYTKLWSEEPKI